MMDDYWLTHTIALRVAERRARLTGVRQRVSMAPPWAPRFMGKPCRWHITEVVAEPCS